MNIDKMTTEGRNPDSEMLDSMTAEDIVSLMSAEDEKVVHAVSKEADAIAEAIKVIANRISQGGRLIYLGAGTSGRLGVLDASECPPTFNTPPGLVIGIIAGGRTALTTSLEGVEDHPETAVEDLKANNFFERDVLVGIATSGRTPYVLGGLEYARQLGAFSIGLTCNEDSEISRVSELTITPVVGPEIVSGSTRLKAGTATKMVLNMLTTGVMVLLGKTYGNLMVDLQAKNSKLAMRSTRIVVTLTGLTENEAETQLQRCDGDVKTAIVSQQMSISPDQARELLAHVEGHLRRALESGTSEQ
jgi:N-acetylmuramic acid 6-phosphate etherase